MCIRDRYEDDAGHGDDAEHLVLAEIVYGVKGVGGGVHAVNGQAHRAQIVLRHGAVDEHGRKGDNEGRHLHLADEYTLSLIHIYGNRGAAGVYAESLAAPAPAPQSNYGRYWHGYLAVLKPLLSLFTYEQLRVVNAVWVALLRCV